MVDPASIKLMVFPQPADATDVSWDWGGRVGNAPADTPRTPDTDEWAARFFDDP
jgi:hypothetical protein